MERLLEVLGALREDPDLGDQFVLHGGTALNVFHGEIPRLSVDIDLMYVGEIDVDRMREQRPRIDARFREVVGALGYSVQATNDEHSGRTYRVKYPGDYLKVDISYLARVALLDPEMRSCQYADPPAEYPVVQLQELVAGKVKAMIERDAARDLYDLYRMADLSPMAFDDPLARALTIRSLCAADPFPFVTDPVAAVRRLGGTVRDFLEPLVAVLPVDQVPDFETMLDAVAGWLEPLSRKTAAEQEFMMRLGNDAEYCPELLFAEWPEVLDRAEADPVMAWKRLNLERRLAGPSRGDAD
ncbi:MAG: nucleotidyl transferase AbiEii/AbiGii toxin family protein [Coriobacteriia bacterium]|nr:nucleotidyl transferase AbiEii/AbiGii toxin family protein [Coriobacteriia bacterium]